tara:strand:+ start:711 stop:983 length:273 start_codon:yes stop_codon:yes gene_type:complete
METVSKNQVWVYHGPDYNFSLSDEKFHDHACLIIKPSHIRVLKNFTDMATKDLKAKIIEDWFAESNLDVKERNNQKARQRRLLNKESNNA